MDTQERDDGCDQNMDELVEMDESTISEPDEPDEPEMEQVEPELVLD